MLKIAIFSLLLVFVSCSKEYEREQKLKSKTHSAKSYNAPTVESNPYAGKVLETMDAAKYTYVKIKNSKGEELWAAGPTTKLKVGDEISLGQAMLMQNFKSKSLNRVFTKIYFVQQISLKDGKKVKSALQNEHAQMKADVKKIDINKIKKGS